MDDEDFQKFNVLINENGLSPLEALEVIEGKQLLCNVLAEKVINEKVEKLKKKHKAKWPSPPVKWDTVPERWYLSLDDHSTESFAMKFPDAELVWVDLAQLHDKLANGSKRVKDPFSSNYKCKTARLVVHLDDGGEVSPPMIIHNKAGLHIVGGNHRFGWARHITQLKIPVIICASQRTAIATLIDLDNSPT